eukprot:Nk52_evm129s221 gene=Nk52_evmTU129s221
MVSLSLVRQVSRGGASLSMAASPRGASVVLRQLGNSSSLASTSTVRWGGVSGLLMRSKGNAAGSNVLYGVRNLQSSARSRQSNGGSNGNGESSAKMKWFWIPVPAGIAYIGAQHLYRMRQRDEKQRTEGGGASARKEEAENEFLITVLSQLPSRIGSRLWGIVHRWTVPEGMRERLYKAYTRIFGCNLDEMAEPDLKKYANLNEFFYRELKSGIRPVTDQVLASPADGKVLHFGEVKDNQVEQVKGVTYDLQEFLGKGVYREEGTPADPSKKLFCCIIYLAPGDYHRYHSSADWTATVRRHFPGELWSVSPSVVGVVKNLFSYNERVVLSGQWEYGFFSYAPIGAYNVGSIHIDCDEEVITNQKENYTFGKYHEKVYQTPVKFSKGERIGGFQLGSTVVLIFEAPKNFQFTVKPGQKLKYGEPIGSLDAKFVEKNNNAMGG